MARPLLPIVLFSVALAQQKGREKEESHQPITLTKCTKAQGCVTHKRSLTMDAQWRWLHDARKNHYKNCISGTPPAWDTDICASGAACAKGCALEGLSDSDYETVYGVKTVPGGVNLKFRNGESIGSRVYMMEDESRYEMFKLLNKEFTIDVEVSTLECGLNGAVYFVEMDADGGMGKGDNSAGAKYGTGYCDAQCPHDLKFIEGEANFKGWHETKTGPEGHYGVCCAEMDIWEANREATAFTTHACDTKGPLKCEGQECGDVNEDCTCCGDPDCSCCGRYQGVCDKDGCDYNSFRLGDEKFYGHGSEFKVDTSKPITVVTQFLTDDGTDSGNLKEVRRLYVQDGKVIKNSQVTNLEGFSGDSITNEMCLAQKKTFDNPDDFTPKGSMKGMGDALARGVVLVLSLWDDMKTQMDWLDAASPWDKPEKFPLSKPGVRRGPCEKGSGDPHKLRQRVPDAHVTYANIRIGEIDSTYGENAEDTVNSIDDAEGGSSTGGNHGGEGGNQGGGGHQGGGGQQGGGGGHQGGGGSGHEGDRDEVSFAAECCTASLESSDPCRTCWKGAALGPGHWCAQEDRCSAHCGGTWCPNGAEKKFEVPELPVVLPRAAQWSSGPVLATTGIAIPLLAMVAGAWRHRPRQPQAHRDSTYEELQPQVGVAA